MGKVKGEYRLSFWEKSIFFSDIDVVIIGSGIVGLNAAIHLKESNPFLKIVILERGPLPIGASTRNAGFACFGSVTELLEDIEKFGEESVWKIVEMRYRGLMRLKQRFGTKQLDFHAWGGFELFRQKEDAKIYHNAIEQIPYLNRVLSTITQQKATFLPADHHIQKFGFRGIEHLILNQAEGQLNTGALMQALLKHAQKLGVHIFNGVKVKDIQNSENQVDLLINKSWSIASRKVIIATNGFANRLIPDVQVKPARNQVLITTPIPKLNIKGTFHYDRGYFYFRNVGNRILIGGGRNLAMERESTDVLGTTPFIRGVLLRILREHILPDYDFDIDQTWSGIMGVGQHKQPIINKINNHTYVGIRLGGMGVAIGNLVGEEVAKLVLQDF